jgi:Pectobacterium phage endonuclease
MSKRAAAKRFWEKVGPPTETGCRLWLGTKHYLGYGHFRLDGKIEYAHRVAFLLANGRWPTPCGRHSCDTPACCEPSHVTEGTHGQNMHDCVVRGRNRSPRPGNGYSKLSEMDKEIIRKAGNKANKSALARHFNVTPSRIRQVLQ